MNKEEKTKGQLLEELEAVFDSAKDPIVLVDLTGKIIKVNRATVRFSGYYEEELVGKRFQILKIFTPKSIGKMVFAFTRVASGREILPFEVEGYTKAGERKYIRIHSSLLNRNGKAEGVVAVITDITDYKKTEEDLRRMIATLQQYKKLLISSENRSIELKKEINKLSEELGKPKPY